MARPLRVLVAGGWYHVTGRGNRREALFRGPRDRQRFLGLVAELPERFRFKVHAFVLMDNHYHLLMRQGRLDSPWEQSVGGWYLGDAEQARKLCRGRKLDAGEQTEVRRVRRVRRMELRELIRAAEKLLDRKWPEMLNRHGDWGRDGVVHVATRYGGYRLPEVLRVLPGVKYQAAAEGVRRFLLGLEKDAAKARLVAKLRS